MDSGLRRNDGYAKVSENGNLDSRSPIVVGDRLRGSDENYLQYQIIERPWMWQPGVCVG